jgi:hypothetical protein
MVVQVFDIKPSKNGRMSCIVSDGDFFTKALINDSSILKQGKFEIMKAKPNLLSSALKGMEFSRTTSEFKALNL